MADYSDLKNKFQTDDVPTGSDYGELIQLAGDAKDKADSAVPDNGDGSVTINNKKIIPASKDAVVSDNKDNTITVNGKTYVPVVDNQDGTITVNTQRYTPADASKVVKDNKDNTITVNNKTYIPVSDNQNGSITLNGQVITPMDYSSVADTIAKQKGQLSSTYDLDTLLDSGTYWYGDNSINFAHGPSAMKNMPRWGTVLVWKHEQTIFQQINTNQNEVYYRTTLGGADNTFQETWKVFLLASENTATNFEDYKAYVDNQLSEIRDSLNAGLPTIDPDFMNNGIVVGAHSSLNFGGYRRVEFNKFIITELKFTITFKSGLTTGEPIVTFPFKVTNSAFNFMDVQSKLLCGFQSDGTTFQYIRMASGYSEQPSYTDSYDFHSVFIYDK